MAFRLGLKNVAKTAAKVINYVDEFTESERDMKLIIWRFKIIIFLSRLRYSRIYVIITAI